MNRRQLREGYPFGEGDASPPPLPKGLGGKPEFLAHNSLTDSIDKRAINMSMRGRHGPIINGALKSASDETFIALNGDHPFTEEMGASLIKTLSRNIRHEMDVQGLKPIDLARKLDFSPQRLNNYIHETKPRAPDIISLVQIARALRTTPDRLLGLSEAAPLDVYNVILRLLELEGLPRERADAIATVVRLALQVLASFPDEGDARTRALLAAQAAWQLTQPSKPS